MLAALVLGGPACALLVAAPSTIYRSPSRTVFQGSAYLVQVLAASLAFVAFSKPLLIQPQLTASFVYGVLAAGFVFFSVNVLTSSGLMRLKYRLSLGEIVREMVLPPLPSDALAIVTTLATALAITAYGPAAGLVLLSGAALSLIVVKQVREHHKRKLRAEAENAALREALRESNLNLAARMVGQLALRDGHAQAHAAASALYADDLAREMGLGEGRAQEVRLAALLQDVGLLYVPDEVLLTPPEKLNSLGRMRLEEHPVSSEKILAAVPGLHEAAQWARWHHERVDGTGYPDRLRGEWLPLEARILAAATFYASLVLDSPHSPRLSPEEARRALIEEMDRAVDGLVAKTFLRVLDREGASYAVASDGRFRFPEEELASPPTADNVYQLHGLS